MSAPTPAALDALAAELRAGVPSIHIDAYGLKHDLDSAYLTMKKAADALDDLQERLRTTSTARAWDSVGRAYDYPEHLPQEAADAIAALKARVETLTAERQRTPDGRTWQAACTDWAARNATLQAKLVTATDRALAADAARASAEAALARMSAQVTVLTEAHAAASAMNRSAWEIAERNGEQTNWPAFRKQLLHALETSHEALNLLTAKPEKRT